MPGHRIVVETDRNGQPVRIIRRHSTSGHHHHHSRHSSHSNHSWDDERADVTNGELAAMRERERLLLENNDALARENNNLKVGIDQAERNLRHYARVDAQLRSNIQALAVENGDLRRTLEGVEERHRDKTKELRHKVTRLENENDKLVRRVRELSRQLRDGLDDSVRRLKEEVAKWRNMWEDLERRYSRLRDNLDGYIKDNDDLKEENGILLRQNDSYKAILRRHHLI